MLEGLHGRGQLLVVCVPVATLPVLPPAPGVQHPLLAVGVGGVGGWGGVRVEEILLSSGEVGRKEGGGEERRRRHWEEEEREKEREEEDRACVSCACVLWGG